MWQIPRIILTHPSTSDEDVELLTQSPCRELLRDFEYPGKWVHADRCDSAFCLPWPQIGAAEMQDTDCYSPAICFISYWSFTDVTV